MTQTQTKPTPPYVCRDCGHPRFALVPLRRMTPDQRKCTECAGPLTATRQD